MANRQRSRALQWPRGILNQILLVVSAALFVVGGVGLIRQVFFGQRLHLRDPGGCDLVLRAAVLLFLLLLLCVQRIRQSYRSLLIAAVLMACAQLLARVVVWFPSPWRLWLEWGYSAIVCAATAVAAFALLSGERFDTFFLSLPSLLLGIDPDQGVD